MDTIKATALDRQLIKMSFEGLDVQTLAIALNCSKVKISQIKNAHCVVSARRAKEIERLTKGQVPAAVLRPDIFAEDAVIHGQENTE